MINTFIKSISLQKITLVLFLIFISFLTYNIVKYEDIKPILFLVFSLTISFLYFKQFELLILLVLIINHDFFSLVPMGTMGRESYRDLLFIIIFITGLCYFFAGNKQGVKDFKYFAIFFFIIAIIGVFNAFFQGQPLILGLKAAKSYYFILFYFVFASKKINQQKLFKLIILTGILLFVLNNIQYILWDKVRIFQSDYIRSEIRAGSLRFLTGSFFTIFTPIIAFGEYLKTNKKIYLYAFIYMVITVIIQGQTRAVFFGLTITVFLMLYLSRRINLKKVAFIVPSLIIVSILVVPLLKSTFLGELYKITESEVEGSAGNVGIRMIGYKYYFGEVLKSPLFGRGIWNYVLTRGNPEDMQRMQLYLSDIGIMWFIFHFGMLGVIWLLFLLMRVYKTAFQNINKLKEGVHYGLIGYFVFSLSTIVTLNSFTGHKTLIYLTLTLALLNQPYQIKQKGIC